MVAPSPSSVRCSALTSQRFTGMPMASGSAVAHLGAFLPAADMNADTTETHATLPPMSAADALEIATIALIKSRSKFSVPEIVEALRKTSKSAVYRHIKAYVKRLGDLSPAEQRWRRQHLPSHLTDYMSPAEKARDAERRYRRWTSRPRRQSN